MHSGELRSWLRARQHLLLYTIGSLLVAIWTLLRFFTQRTIFDLVSQQVIVHQWLHGGMSVAHMGQSAYVPKMLLLYVPVDLLPGSPRLKLILLTLAINIATFIVLGIVLERILQEFGVRISGMFYAALLWLSAIAGSVFWVEFANSRNLEVAGGLVWVYVALRFMRRPGWWHAIGLAALGGLVFFSDPLQLYMTAVPLLAYATVLAITKQVAWKVVARLFGVTLGGYIVAQLLFTAAGHWLQASFHDTGNVSTLQVSAAWARQSLSGTIKAFVSLFAGAADAGRLRELANLCLALLGAGALAYTWRHGGMPKRLGIWLACMVGIDVAVYIASGQAAQGAATNRYLIMLAPVAVMACGTLRIPRHLRPYVTGLAILVLSVNALTLGVSLLQSWNTRFPQDAHLESAYRYVSEHPTLHAYSSTDTGMPMLYFHSLPAVRDLPLGCLGGRLVRTHYSMDKDFAQDARTPTATAAIVFDGVSIANKPNVCTIASVTAQFGTPLAVDHTDDGSVVLLYTQYALRLSD